MLTRRNAHAARINMAMVQEDGPQLWPQKSGGRPSRGSRTRGPEKGTFYFSVDGFGLPGRWGHTEYRGWDGKRGAGMGRCRGGHLGQLAICRGARCPFGRP
jgi:hypothetical protein